MWLSPLKGAHLTLGQLDKTLPVDMSVEKNKTIERGNIVFISTNQQANGTARFQLYTNAEAQKPNAVPYIVLTGVKDFQAGMAGNIGQAPGNDIPGTEGTLGGADWFGKASVVGVGDVKGPRITAISLVQPAEWQTTAFDQSNDAMNGYYVGAPLTVNAAGVVTPWLAATGGNIVGYVTATPKTRWINDLGASADGARISGGNAKVLEFSTAWIPTAHVAASGSGDSATPDNIGKLNVGAPKVSGQAAKATEAPKAPETTKTQGK